MSKVMEIQKKINALDFDLYEDLRYFVKEGHLMALQDKEVKDKEKDKEKKKEKVMVHFQLVRQAFFFFADQLTTLNMNFISKYLFNDILVYCSKTGLVHKVTQVASRQSSSTEILKE